MMSTQIFFICNHDQHETSKTLTIAKQSEVPTKDYNRVTSLSSIQFESRFFKSHFAVAAIKYNDLGTPFFKNYIQKINIQFSTMNIKHPFIDKLTTASFTTVLEKIIPLFSFAYQKNSEKPTYNKTNTLQTLHFPLEKIKTLLPKTENSEPFFSELYQAHFLLKLKQFSSFTEKLSKNSDDSCSLLIEKNHYA